MESIEFGDITVTRIREYYGPIGFTPADIVPDIPEETWREARSWLVPHFLDPGTQVVNAAVQTWLIRSEGRNILVDTGAGNHKERPYAQLWSHLDTDFLARLEQAGVRPEDVDIVINTHLHNDHVGWNTILEDRHWVPTFPNATYLIPKTEFDFWNPDNGHTPRTGRGNQNVFEDSVAPVHRAGLTVLWEDSHRIDAGLRLEAAPGHTPGSSVLTLASGSDRAVFVGDLLHSPAQILAPDANSCFCEDPAGARATRRRILGRAADQHALVVPAHFGGHGAVEVVRDGSKFAVKGWAPLTPYTDHD